jgi:Domain of unknown function (DUF4418)
MKKLVSSTAIVSGLLLLLVPRYILPACEYLGHPAMHCSDTARAEFVAGGLLITLGVAAALLRSKVAGIICSGASLILYVVAFRLPDTFGYCHSTQMPCNYGMVPGIRFVAVLSAISMAVAFVGAVKSYRKKRKEVHD